MDKRLNFKGKCYADSWHERLWKIDLNLSDSDCYIKKNTVRTPFTFLFLYLVIIQTVGLDDQRHFQHQPPPLSANQRTIGMSVPRMPFIPSSPKFSKSNFGSVSVYQRFIGISDLCLRLIHSFCASLGFRFRRVMCHNSVLCFWFSAYNCALWDRSANYSHYYLGIVKMRCKFLIPPRKLPARTNVTALSEWPQRVE